MARPTKYSETSYICLAMRELQKYLVFNNYRYRQGPRVWQNAAYLEPFFPSSLSLPPFPLSLSLSPSFHHSPIICDLRPDGVLTPCLGDWKCPLLGGVVLPPVCGRWLYTSDESIPSVNGLKYGKLDVCFYIFIFLLWHITSRYRPPSVNIVLVHFWSNRHYH